MPVSYTHLDVYKRQIPYTMAGIALIVIAALIYKNEVTKNKRVKGE